MQHIQDNEFDQLFRDRFDEAEVIPSANLWSNIEKQLGEKPKRVFPVYWLAAVIGLALVSVGLLLYRGENNQEHRAVIAAGGVTVVPKNGPAGTSAAAYEPAAEKSPVTANVSRQSGISRKLLHHLYNAPKIEEISSVAERPGLVIADSKKELTDLQPLALNAHPYTKEIIVKQEKLAISGSALSKVEEMVLANAAEGPAGSDEVINENENRTGNKGIRNVGDLINYVVDKVDKREEKIIQFKTEDDNSSIIAINIGMFKFNQRKHK